MNDRNDIENASRESKLSEAQAAEIAAMLRHWDDLDRVQARQSVKDVLAATTKLPEGAADALSARRLAMQGAPIVECQYGKPGIDSCFECDCQECAEEASAIVEDSGSNAWGSY